MTVHGALSFLAGTLAASVKEISASVAASEHDSVEQISTGGVGLTNTLCGFGATHLAGSLFLVPTLPQGRRIVSAEIQYAAGLTFVGAATGRLWCENADAAAAFAQASNDISNRALTAAFVDWVQAEAWTEGDRTPAQLTPDLTPIVQPVVNRPGFNGVLNFITTATSGGPHWAASFDHAMASPPTLTVRFVQ